MPRPLPTSRRYTAVPNPAGIRRKPSAFRQIKVSAGVKSHPSGVFFAPLNKKAGYLRILIRCFRPAGRYYDYLPISRKLHAVIRVPVPDSFKFGVRKGTRPQADEFNLLCVLDQQLTRALSLAYFKSIPAKKNANSSFAVSGASEP